MPSPDFWKYLPLSGDIIDNGVHKQEIDPGLSFEFKGVDQAREWMANAG
jgi:hypothetical protein